MRVVPTPSDRILDAAARALDGVEIAPTPEAPATYPLVLVTWHDAFFDFDQMGPEDSRSDYVVRTVGFLINEGPRFLSVAQEVLPDGEGFRAVTHIPHAIVESVVGLDPGSAAIAAGEVG